MSEYASVLVFILIVISILVCNVLFSMFRAYQNSLPFPHPQNLIINVLFSYLSITWQAANILSGLVLILNLCLVPPSSTIFCFIHFGRHIQIYSTFISLVLVSCARFFANFWPHHYFGLNHRRLESISRLMIGILALAPNLVMYFLCEAFIKCPIDRSCADEVTQVK